MSAASSGSLNKFPLGKNAFILLFIGLLVIGGVGAAAYMRYEAVVETSWTPPVDQPKTTPVVSARIPAPDAIDVPPRAKITVVFSTPMVALTQVQGAAAGTQWIHWPVTISPAIPGKWRWISTYAAQFTPEGGLSPSTLYTVTVPAGIETLAGEKTEKDGGWKFETSRPRVVTTDPVENNSLAGPTTQVTLHFNQEVNPASVAKHVHLFRLSGATVAPSSGGSSSGTGSAVTGSGTEMSIKSVHFAQIMKDLKMVTDKTAVVLTPEKPLSQSTSYLVAVTSGLLGAHGDLGTKEDFGLHFSTVGPLQVISAQEYYGSIQLQFSSPLPSDTDEKTISFRPPLPNGATFGVSMNVWDDSRQMTISPGFLNPSTAYTVTISKKLADTYGQHLSAPYTYSFTTPPTPPQVAIEHSKGDFGIFERDKPPVYRLTSVNVSAITVEFAELPMTEFMELRTKKIGNGQVLPDLTANNLHQTWSLPTVHKENQWETTILDVQKKLGKTLKPGIYALLLRSPEFVLADGRPQVIEQYFSITNTGLTLKYSGDQALVWATDLSTGAPIKGAQITFHSLHGKETVHGKTDANGFFSSPVSMADYKMQSYEWQPEFWVTAKSGDDFAFVGSQWNGGFTPGDFSLWTDFHGADAPPFRLMQQMVTDRPMYRPGDTVSFKGMVRLRDWNGILQLPGNSRQIQVVIQDPGGTEVYRKTLPFTEFGGFFGSFKTAENASIGDYIFQLQLLPESDAGGIVYSGSFSVFAYRKPEYKVDVKTEAEDYYSGQTIGADIDGAYYFGAPLSNAKVDWRVTLTDWYFNRFTDGWYSFSTEDSWCWWQCNGQMSSFTQGTGTLDASGHMHIAFPVSIDDKKLSQIASIEADVTDPNHQLVSNRVSVPIHKSSVYVGVQNLDYATQPGEAVRIGIITLDTKGKPVPNQTVTLKLSSRTWNSIKQKGVDGEFTFDNQPVDTFLSSQTVTTGTDGKIIASVTLPTGGQFSIVAETTDGSGRKSQAGTSAYAWSRTYVNWPHLNNDRIDVIADKPEYAVGDTAKLLVKSPFQGEGVKALVTVERENVLTKKVIDVTGNALPIEIPITEDFVPNVYVSVVIVKPRMGETFDDEGKDTGVPAFRIGLTQLRVETKKKALNVTIESGKKQYLPGEKVSATISVRDSAGKPVRGEFTFAAVDMSVLALAGFRKPDLVANFYMQHGLGVFTSQMLTYLVERFKPGSKGGGGADLADRKRGNFLDTAYWNPTVVTDENGKASVSFTLPDNLTTWHLLALGSTADGKFGGGEKEIIATKNVIIRTVRPRFAVRGDKVSLGAIVHNFLPESHTFSVTLSGSGFTLTGKQTQKITVKAGAMTSVTFPVTVRDVANLSLNMKAETDGNRDEVAETIPVFIFGTPQSVATTGQTQSIVTEKVLVPSEKDASSGTLDITVSPSLATYLPGGLDYVLKYPYGCAEQTASTFLPQLALKRLQGFDAFKILSDKALEENITTALAKLYRFQKPDGGFGYWEESYESQPYLTAYIVYALRLSRDSGYAVDVTSMKRAQDYLGNVLHSASLLQRPQDLATRAYILFVLAETGTPDSNLISNLYEKRQNLPVFSQAELAMALQKAGMQSKARGVLQHILDGALIDPRGAHVEESQKNTYRFAMQTNTRTTAETLQAMLRLDPKNALVPSFVRFLLASRKDGHWDSTQSTVQTVLAFTEFLKSTNELSADYIAGIDMNGTIVASQTFNAKNILTRKEVTKALAELPRGKETTVKIGLDGTGTLYYDMLLSYFSTADVIPPADQGISISREIGSMDQKGPQGITSVKVGDSYRVTLTMTVPEDRYFVAVESPHPAGLEGIDPNLQTSKQSGLPQDIQNQNSSQFWWYDDEDDNGLWRFSHKEYRDDRVFLFADYLPAGVYKYTYLVRATTPGTFRMRPAHIFEMYNPETFGQTDGGWFTVTQ